MCHSKYKITIPEPCHEDWNKMTPEEQGRFCGVCSKTVIDFSSKSPGEVDQIIDNNKGVKICGRFSRSQVQPGPVVLEPSMSMHSLRRFVAALFLVFGMSLFSCNAQDVRLVGDIAVEEVMGKVKQVEVPDTTVDIPKIDSAICTPVLGQIVLKEEHYVMGGPRFSYNEEIIKGEVVAEPDTLMEVPVVTEPEPEVHVVGLMAIDIVPGEDPIEPQVEDSLLVVTNDPDPIRVGEVFGAEGLVLNVFPNPSSGEITVEYKVSDRSKTILQLYDLTGKLRKQWVDLESSYEGTYRYKADLSDLPNGTYIVRYESGGKVKSAKVELFR